MITRHRWLVLAALALVQFVIVADSTIVNVALPVIGAEFGLTTVGIAWIINAYLLAAGGLLLLGGRLADLLGRRRLFVVGALVFGCASISCALAPTAGMLVLGRTLQGVGEAIAAPAALSIIAMIFRTPAERATALGVWGGLAGLGATLGVTASGILVTLFGWRSIFWVNVPFVLAAVVAVPLLLHVTPTGPRLRSERPDVGGAVTLTAGMLGVLQGLIAAQHTSLGSASVCVPAAGGVALLLAFVVIETRHPHPLVPLAFFAHRTRIVATALSAMTVGAMAFIPLLLTLYQQDQLGRTALQTGLSYLAFALPFGAVAFASGAVVKRWGTTRTTVVAFGSAASGMALLLRLDPAGSFWVQTLPAFLALAVGLGLAMPPLQGAALHGLSETDAGLGSGVQTATQTLSNAVGVGIALLVSVQVAAAGGDSPAAQVAGTRAAFAVSGVVLLAGAVLAALFLRIPTPPTSQELARLVGVADRN